MVCSKLNIGCGYDIRDGWVNLDRTNIPGVDVVHDIEKLPLPFADGRFEEILCQDVLEHIEYIPVMRELYRILKKGGKLKIRVPHFTSRTNFGDPTHKKLFSSKTFMFFEKNTDRCYYFDFCFEKVSYLKIAFRKGPLFYDYLVEPVVNLHPKMMALYEATCLSRFFPADSIIVVLEK